MSTVTEQDHLLDLQQRMAGKTKAEQADIIRTYAKEQGITVEEAPKVMLSDDQVRMIVEGSTEEAKKIAREAANDVIRKHDVTLSEAKDIADQEVSSTLKKHMRHQEDLRMAAEVIRSIARASTGRGARDEMENAFTKEAEYLKKSGRTAEKRAMSMGTDSTGGYLGGEIFSTLLYDNVARVSQARKYCTILNMDREILRLPTLTATVTASQDSEAGTISSSQPTFSQFVLNTKKINVLSKPFSVELLETADPALVQTLINFATIEIAKKEDALVFTNILAQSANVVTMGTGLSAITDVTFDDMADLINELDEQYLPDEDIKGSGIVGGEARFWAPRKLINVLAKSKGNDNYHWANVQELKSDKRVHGFDLKRVVSMSQAPAAATKFMTFGNLGYHFCGVRPGYRIELQSQGTVDSVNLNETNSYALRVTEFFDSDSIDDEAFSILKTAA